MAEGIGIIANGGEAAKQPLKSALTIKPLTDKSFAARHIHLWLDPPTAHKVPTAFLHSLTNFRQHCRIAFRDPFIELRGTGGHRDLGIVFQPIERRTKSAVYYGIGL